MIKMREPSGCTAFATLTSTDVTCVSISLTPVMSMSATLALRWLRPSNSEEDLLRAGAVDHADQRHDNDVGDRDQRGHLHEPPRLLLDRQLGDLAVVDASRRRVILAMSAEGSTVVAFVFGHLDRTEAEFATRGVAGMFVPETV